MQSDAEPADFTRLDDPAFLAERARVRGQLEQLTLNAAGRADLKRLYEAMDLEFDRRASAAWTAAGRARQLTSEEDR
jgi:hypothetical protein